MISLNYFVLSPKHVRVRHPLYTLLGLYIKNTEREGGEREEEIKRKKNRGRKKEREKDKERKE